MKLLQGYTVVSLLGASRDAGWVVTMILICVATFTISSIFAICLSHSLRPGRCDVI